MRLAFASALALSALLPSPGLAQPAQRFGQSFTVGGVEVDLVTQWAGARSRVEVVTAEGRRTLHSGRPVYAFGDAGEEGLLVALVGAGTGVEVALVPITDGRPGPAQTRSLTRIAGSDRAPVGAAVAARPDGFAVFWQEASTTNPNQPYQTFLARLDARGRARGQTEAVPAPWPLADVTWLAEEQRYYFLLFYGQGPELTRLCGVHVAGTPLRPQEHPWWASRPGAIDEARLARRGRRVVAVYRDGATLREADVTDGAWSREVPEPRSHGAVPPTQTFVLRSGEELEVRARPLM